MNATKIVSVRTQAPLLGKCHSCGASVHSDTGFVEGNTILCEPCMWGEHNIQRMTKKSGFIPVESEKDGANG